MQVLSFDVDVDVDVKVLVVNIDSVVAKYR
jgi:hypothetical protein